MKITDTTPLRTTIAIAVTVIAASATVGWIAANGIRDIKSDIAEVKAELISQGENAWTYNDQQRWVSVFAKENRFTNIDVPLIPAREKSQKKPN